MPVPACRNDWIRERTALPALLLPHTRTLADHAVTDLELMAEAMDFSTEDVRAFSDRVVNAIVSFF